MTPKKYWFIVVSIFIIMVPLMCWAAVSGYAWISVPVWLAWGILVGILRIRVKELAFDERAYSVTEKSFTIACIIFMFLAGTSGLTLITISISRDIPEFLQAIGWTLLGSSTALALFFSLAKIYLSRKMGGKV